MHLAHVISPYFHREVVPYTPMQSSRLSDAQQRSAAGATPAQQANLRFKKKPAAVLFAAGPRGCGNVQRTKLKPESGICFPRVPVVKVAAFWFISVCDRGCLGVRL